VDGEAIGTLLIIAFWVISGVSRAMSKRKKKPVEQPRQAPSPTLSAPAATTSPAPTAQRRESKRPLGPKTVGDLLREMMKEINGGERSGESGKPSWQEPTVLSEHQQTASEHRQTTGETSWSKSEHSWSMGEHRGSAGEHSGTPSEHRATFGEHSGSDTEAFLDSEQTRYSGQLTRYARVMSQIDSRPIKLGLYFPLMKAWREWSYNGA